MAKRKLIERYVLRTILPYGLAALILRAFRRIPFVYHISDMWPESVSETGALGNCLPHTPS